MKTKPIARLVEPARRADGTCSACVGGWTCKFHQEENTRRDRELSATLRRCAESIKWQRIARVCAAFELESDEFLTREQKAEAMLTANPNLA